MIQAPICKQPLAGSLRERYTEPGLDPTRTVKARRLHVILKRLRSDRDLLSQQVEEVEKMIRNGGGPRNRLWGMADFRYWEEFEYTGDKGY